MSLEAQYLTATYSKKIAVLKSQTIAEIKFSGEIYEVQAAYPVVNLISCEVSSGRATYSGRLICTIIYTDPDGGVCRVQKGAEFSHFCDDGALAPMQRANCALTVQRVNIKRDGSSWVVSAVVGAEIEVFAAAERGILTSIGDGILNKQMVKLYSATPFSGEGEVEDEFDCNAEDILIPAAEVLVSDCNCLTGVIEVKGELCLSVLAMRDSKPVSLERVIPYKVEIPQDNSIVTRKAFCRAEVKDLSVNVRVNEEKGKAEVELTASLAFFGEYMEDEEQTVIFDAFSPKCNLNLKFNEECGKVIKGYKNFSERVRGACATKSKLDYSCTFLAAALPKAEFSVNRTLVEGVAQATLIYEQNGELRTSQVSLPFSVPVPEAEYGKNVTVAVCGFNLKQISEGECEAECVLKISVQECEPYSVKYVTEAEEGESLPPCDSAITVYIPACGDELWNVAKKLCVSPELIQKSNPDVKFPLTGSERICIYRCKS